MHKRLAPAGCISRPSTHSVWISDALLAETFNRFSEHKRYGSSVPGPLEAQRRAAKRKNTSLAYAGSGGVSIDPSVLFGSSANNADWWRGPKEVAAVPATPSPILPSWMFPFSGKNKNTLRHAEFEIAPTQLVPRGLSDQQVKKLARCQTLSQVEEWSRQEGFNLHEDAHVGRAILDHILEGNLGNLRVQPIAAYICDPTFHHSGTSFILDLIRAIVPHSWDPVSWSILRQSICSATELGLINVDDLRSIINVVLSATNLRLSIAGIGYISRRERAKLYLVSGILDSLDRSPILQITDIGTLLLSKLFSKFIRHAYLPWCEKTLWRLLPWASKNYVPIICQLIHNQLQFQRGQRAPDERVGQALADRLLRADPVVLQMLLAHSTESLLEFSRETKTMLYRFMWYHWCCTLAILGSQVYNVSLTKNTWDDLQHIKSTLTPKQRPLAFAWTAMSLSSDLRTSTKLSDRVQSLDCFEILVASLSDSTTDYSHLVVSELGNLALPHKDVLLRNLTRLSLSSEEAFYGDGSQALSNTDLVIREGITTSILNKNIQNAHFDYHEELAEILNRASYGFPAFKILSRRMIHKSTMSFGIVCQLLECNTMLKIVLQTPPLPVTRPDQMQPMNSGSLVDLKASSASEATIPPPRSGPITPCLPSREQIVDLIHHLAISFTSSPVATPRATLRRVYWCYLFLCRYGVPIEPVIIRALWHAGVTRYGEGGTAATLLKWLLKRVRELEGEDVAKLLLWSETFRLTRTAQVDAWSEISEEEEQAVFKTLTEELTSDDDVEAIEPPPEASTRARLPSPTAPVHFPSEEIDALLTGDEEVNQEVRNKVQFLQSEPPADDVDALLIGDEDGDQELRNKVRFYQWSPPVEEIDELLAGDEVSPELKKKISFIQSEPFFVPFWVPKDMDESGNGSHNPQTIAQRVERQQKNEFADRNPRSRSGQLGRLPVRYHPTRMRKRMMVRSYIRKPQSIGDKWSGRQEYINS